VAKAAKPPMPGPAVTLPANEAGGTPVVSLCGRPVAEDIGVSATDSDTPPSSGNVLLSLGRTAGGSSSAPQRGSYLCRFSV
jgi:hypothetical protein